MFRSLIHRCLLGGLLALACLGTAYAGRACDAQHDLKPERVAQSMTLAYKTWQALDSSGARVVLLARAGQDLSEYGLHYSHLGFAYRQDDADGGHVWRVLHKLNVCGTAESAIYRQGLGEFFLDDLWQYEAAWVVLSPTAQAAVLAVLQDPAKALVMHQPHYSMVSYAWATQYQQSNQWALETLAYALTIGSPDAVSDRTQAQAWLQRNKYVPSTLHIGPLVRLGARMTRANVAFDDHPNEKRFSDRIETVTVDSMFAWLQRSGLASGEPTTLR